MIAKEPIVVTLENGLRIAYLYDESLVAHMGITILAGSRYEKFEEQGLAHFIEHCIFKGTQKRKAFHILSRLDSVGGELNAYTTKEEICIYASFLKQHTERALELIFDLTFHSSFPIKEIEKEKEIILDELNSYLDNPGDKIFDDFEALIFPNNSLGYNILGTEQSVRSFTRTDLNNYIERFFVPENMVLSYIGNTKQDKFIKLANKYYGRVEPRNLLNILPNHIDYKPQRHRITASNYQTHIMLGGIAPGYMDEDRRVFTLLINLLGGPALNSRLILSIREKFGYSYNVEANYSPYKDTGYWNVYASSDKKYVEKLIKLIYKEFEYFISKKLTLKQLQMAKTQLKGQIALGMDSNSSLMLSYGKSLLIFNQLDTLDEVYTSIDEITLEDVHRVANTYFATNKVSELIFDY